jgi:hypothetical protein
MIVEFPCSFRKRRIEQSPNSNVILRRGKYGGHLIFLRVWAKKKKLKFVFVEKNQMVTRFSSSFRMRRIRWPPNSPNCLSKKQLEICIGEEE